MWKGNDAELEGQAGDEKHQPENENPLVELAHVKALGNRRDLERTGRTVDHGHAVQQQAGGQRPEHEILHRRFGCWNRVTVHRHHRVEREREQFQADIDRHQMAGRDHHHHAEGGKQRQRVVFAPGHLRPFENVAARVEQDDDHREVKEKLQQIGHQVADVHVAEGVGRLTGTAWRR
jgi:hypothetical protein